MTSDSDHPIGGTYRSPSQRFVASVLAPDTVRAASVALQQRGIEVMPLKGALLQRIAYDDPARRVVTDVDLLVAPDEFGQATATLVEAGFREPRWARSMIEVTLRAPNSMTVDLHRQLFGVGRFRMTVADVFGRARPNNELFGAPILRMDDYDLFAHLVGKLASDHVDSRRPGRLAELAYLVDVLGLEAASAARHLDRCGMRRAARYALGRVEAAHPGSVEGILRTLPPDPVGELVVAGASSVIAHTPQRSFPSAIAGHLLNHSLPRAGYAMTAATVNRVRHRLATRRA